MLIELQDVYFDDESAEVVISSLRLGDEQGRCVRSLFKFKLLLCIAGFLVVMQMIRKTKNNLGR